MVVRRNGGAAAIPETGRKPARGSRGSGAATSARARRGARRPAGHRAASLQRAQERAAQAQALLRVASRLGRIGAWSLDLATMNGAWSDELLRIYEAGPQSLLTPERLVGLADEAWRERVNSAMRACHEHGTPVDIEFPSLTLQGRSIWLHLTAEAQRDRDGAVVSMQGAVQDITDRKAVAERVRALSEELAATLEHMSDAFVVLDGELRVTFANAAAARGASMLREQLIGRRLLDMFPTLPGTGLVADFDRARARSVTVVREVYSRTLRRWLELTAYPSPSGVAVCIRNTTAAHEATQRLVESEERYRLLFETSVDGIITASADGAIRHANPAACAMFGRPEAQLQDLCTADLVSPADFRREAMAEGRLREGRALGELTMLRADGSMFEAEVSTSAYRDSEGSALVNIVVRDVTDRVRLRQKLVSLNDDLAQRVHDRTQELERANADLRDFAHSLAHDLRQPLVAVKAFCFALDHAVGSGDAAEIRGYGSRIAEAAQRMDGYVQSLLSLAETAQAELAISEVDLSAIATRVLEELRQQEPRRQVQWTVAPRLRAPGDARLISMLLQNLLGNAWKFTRGRAVAEITFNAERGADGRVVYSVADNGAGFDMSRAQRLFGTFQRFHDQSEFPGTGIGLANAQRIVHKHGGRIWADSRPDAGAIFRFTLAG